MSDGNSRKGFASMSPERQRQIASQGGKAAHAKGTGHEWTAEEAREAGRKGGLASSRRPRPSPVNDTPDVGADIPGGGANP